MKIRILINLSLIFGTWHMLAIVPTASLWKLSGLRFKLDTTISATMSLPNGSDLAADSRERKILDELGIPVGDTPYVAEWQKGFAPTMGLLVWHSHLIHSLYLYGPQNDPLVQLVKHIFHMNAVDVTPEHENILNPASLKVTELAGIRPLIQSKNFAAFVRASCLHEIVLPKKHCPFQEPDIKKRGSECEHINELSKQIYDAFTKESIFPRYFISLVLSAAWYWLERGMGIDALPTNQAVIRFAPSSESLQSLLNSFSTQHNPIERYLSLVTYVSTAGITQEDIALATQAFLPFAPYPPLVQQGWKLTCKSNRAITFPDCGENTLHNLFDFLTFDPETSDAYQPTYLAVNGTKPLPDLLEFYAKHRAVQNSAFSETCQDWADLVSAIPNVVYGNTTYGCDLTPTPDNTLKVMRYLLGISEPAAQTTAASPLSAPTAAADITKKLEKWEDLGLLLSTPDRRIEVEPVGQVDASFGAYTIKIIGNALGHSIKIHWAPGHGYPEFPSATSAIYGVIKEKITEAMVQLLFHLDPTHAVDPNYPYYAVYAQNLEQLNAADQALANLLRKFSPDKKRYVQHVFDAVFNRWVSVGDGYPGQIVSLAVAQAKSGQLQEEAIKFIENMKSYEQLYDIHIDNLSYQLGNDAFEIFSSNKDRLNQFTAPSDPSIHKAMAKALLGIADSSSTHDNRFKAILAAHNFITIIEEKFPEENMSGFCMTTLKNNWNMKTMLALLGNTQAQQELLSPAGKMALEKILWTMNSIRASELSFDLTVASPFVAQLAITFGGKEKEEIEKSFTPLLIIRVQEKIQAALMGGREAQNETLAIIGQWRQKSNAQTFQQYITSAMNNIHTKFITHDLDTIVPFVTQLLAMFDDKEKEEIEKSFADLLTPHIQKNISQAIAGNPEAKKEILDITDPWLQKSIAPALQNLSGIVDPRLQKSIDQTALKDLLLSKRDITHLLTAKTFIASLAEKFPAYEKDIKKAYQLLLARFIDEITRMALGGDRAAQEALLSISDSEIRNLIALYIENAEDMPTSVETERFITELNNAFSDGRNFIERAYVSLLAKIIGHKIENAFKGDPHAQTDLLRLTEPRQQQAIAVAIKSLGKKVNHKTALSAEKFVIDLGNVFRDEKANIENAYIALLNPAMGDKMLLALSGNKPAQDEILNIKSPLQQLAAVSTVSSASSKNYIAFFYAKPFIDAMAEAFREQRDFINSEYALLLSKFIPYITKSALKGDLKAQEALSNMRDEQLQRKIFTSINNLAYYFAFDPHDIDALTYDAIHFITQITAHSSEQTKLAVMQDYLGWLKKIALMELRQAFDYRDSEAQEQLLKAVGLSSKQNILARAIVGYINEYNGQKICENTLTQELIKQSPPSPEINELREKCAHFLMVASTPE